MRNKKVLLWLSGWVDSAVAGYLLKEQGYDVTAWFMINYISDDDSCPTKIDLEEAKKVAKFLDIPFFTFDFVKEYNDRIVKYIYEWYESWITPNPDVLCNSLIKFWLFLDEAIELWFDYVATGHYARIVSVNQNSNPSPTLTFWKRKGEDRVLLKKWLDSNKDQSYFLSGLNQHQLKHSLFPIWELEKSEVRKIAKKINLPNAERKDSQWICFIWKVWMKEFLSKKIKNKSWNILDIEWNILWQHNWAFTYTIWQRRWIDIWWGPALFVLSKDIKDNTITVWTEKDLNLFNSNLISSEFSFLVDCPHPNPLPGGEGINSLSNEKLFAKIRYRQADQEVDLEILEEVILWLEKEKVFKIKVNFREPQRAIASGQVIVLYNEDWIVLWSWIID